MNNEGYCGTCRYMIELTEDGRLKVHGSRATYHLNGDAAGRSGTCDGTGEHPAPLPGFEDPVVAFSSEPKMTRCPICHREDVVVSHANNRMEVHSPLPGKPWDEPGPACPGSHHNPQYID